jgi:hypothetical protein
VDSEHFMFPRLLLYVEDCTTGNDMVGSTNIEEVYVPYVDEDGR